ncbi:putative DNA helicase [Rosa chinensis]|uniref:Putative DNA helicase n=1 Tax=Rosa chinensis TaxID=74649 RepID=A0A2P6P8A3_ROSCH|nr:putative DNA helicase [Rosa chinensis]
MVFWGGYWDISGFERKSWTNTENCKIIIQGILLSFTPLKTYIDCLHIKKSNKSRMLAEAQREVENSLGGNSEEILFYEKRVHTFLVPRIDEKPFVSAGLGISSEMLPKESLSDQAWNTKQ